ncbi:hypothetical protein ACTL6P_21715 [Endozoicomonas acroporae]|uniref:ankyrin repeat domain-containing protein n=1 Tax=Endozoicomonas acroporae TaxID=1701104 RepID=UPI0011AF1F68|nr:ankyrin repeat domain-containing protein [Endozoicomonas acroporae]
METTSQPFSILCCCTNFRECPNRPSNSEQNECRSAGYRKIQITERVNNLSIGERFGERVSKRFDERVSKHSLDMNPEENNHHHVPHIRVPSDLHDEFILIQSTREVKNLQRFHEAINLNTGFWGIEPERKQKIIEELLKEYRSSNWVNMAIMYGYLDVLKYFINKGEEINKVGSSSHIWKAVSHGQLEIVEYLIDLGLKDKDKSFFIHDEGTENEGLIHGAVLSSNMDEDTACRMIELLLSKGEDPDGCDVVTPLNRAMELNKLRIARLLSKRSNLKRYGLLSVSEKKEFDCLMELQNAIEIKKESDIKPLCKKLRLDSATAMQMASRHGFLEVLNYFVGQGKKVCKKSFEAPIWSAVSHGHFDIVKYLTDPKLNDRKKNYYKPVQKSGIDALINAAVQSRWMDEQAACRIIRLLLDRGQPVNGHGKYTPLDQAEELNKTVIVDFLKKKGGLYKQQPEESVCDDMPAPPHDDPAEPKGACGYSPTPSAPPADPEGDYGYSPTPSAPPADPEGDGYFPMPPAPPEYDSLDYRLYPPGTQNFDDPPPSYEESMRMEKNSE